MIVPRLLYYCPLANEGIADYALAQCDALIKTGVSVTLLAPEELLARSPQGCGREPLSTAVVPSRSQAARWRRRVAHLSDTMSSISTLVRVIRAGGFRHVLLATYAEYGAPLWYKALKVLESEGVTFAAVLHDPVRDYVVGPSWWHRYSIRCGYAFLRNVFVHENVDRNVSRIPERVDVTVVPHGPFEFPRETKTRQQVRAAHDIPDEAFLVLSFGQIRDGKNLHLVLDAIREFPDVWLLVAGKEVGGTRRQLEDYQKLAVDYAIADRCRWIPSYISVEEVSNLFTAADAAVMAYSAKFRSASRVLNTAVQFEKVCPASSGPEPLRKQIERYGFGVWIEPDARELLVEGLRKLCA